MQAIECRQAWQDALGSDLATASHAMVGHPFWTAFCIVMFVVALRTL